MKNMLQWFGFIAAVVLLSAQVTIACDPWGVWDWEPAAPATCPFDAGCPGDAPMCYQQPCGYYAGCSGDAAICVPYPLCYTYFMCGEMTEC
jgi:hypothetical protein